MKKRGYVLLLDAIVALCLLILFFVLLFNVYELDDPSAPSSSFRELHYVSENALDVLNKKGILDDIAFQWSENSTGDSVQMYNASVIATRYLESMVPDGIGYRLVIYDGDEQYVINDSSLSPARITPDESSFSTHSSRVLVGYGNDTPTLGYTSRALLTSFFGKTKSEYVFFGGFVGQGNLTRYLDLPDDANVTGAYMELDPGGNFTLYVNGVECGSYEGLGEIRSAGKWDISACADSFSGGRNTLNINFTQETDNFIGGGYIRA